MRILFTILISNLIIAIGFSQSDFRSGFIIKSNNDTVYGFIDYKGNRSNAKKCIFKNELNSESRQFSPDEISGYRFTDSKYYVSKSVITDSIEEKLFLEFLINGIKDIYYYRDEAGQEHYFLDMGDERLVKLKSDERQIKGTDFSNLNKVKGATYVQKSKEYIGVLKYAFKESPLCARKAETAYLNHKSLINITSLYHNEVCKDEKCIVYEKVLPKVSFKMGPVIGINFVSIVDGPLSSPNYDYLSPAEFESQTVPSLGIFIKLGMPYFSERIFFQYDATWSHTSFEATTSYKTADEFLRHIYYVKANENLLNNSGIVKYDFPKGMIRPSIHMGAFFNYAFDSEFIAKHSIEYTAGGVYSENENISAPFLETDYGIKLGCGAIVNLFRNTKEMFIDLSYQRGFGLIRIKRSNYFMVHLGFEIF